MEGLGASIYKKGYKAGRTMVLVDLGFISAEEGAKIAEMPEKKFIEDMNSIYYGSKKNFDKPTEKEISERRRIYSEAKAVGIDLLDLNDEEDPTHGKARREALRLIVAREAVPEEIKQELLAAKKN